MHLIDLADLRLFRHDYDEIVSFDFVTADGHGAGFSRSAGGFVRFDDLSDDPDLDLIDKVYFLFPMWSDQPYRSESSMFRLTGKRLPRAKRDRFQLKALNASLAGEGIGPHIDTWNPKTGVIAATIA